jgi:lipopolysaccharide export LptBFGC system permease protein LptF
MEHRPYPPNATQPPQSRFPWPVIALIVALALLVVTLWLSPSMNKASTKEANMASQTGQLRLSTISLAPQEANNQTNIDVYGQVSNSGGQPVTSAIISAVFKDKNGDPIVTQQQPMERVDLEKKDKTLKSENFLQQPLQPGKSSGFRVSYTEIPQNWDHQPPELSVLQVTVKK